MLKASYDHGIVGQNYISLIQGILSLRSQHRTLLVDDKKNQFANQWYRNIGYAERTLLKQLGEELSIDVLIEIDGHLRSQNTLLSLNQKLLEMGDSPYTNIKEIARKLPECFTESTKTAILKISQKEFDEKFFLLMDKLAIDTLVGQKQKLSDLFLHFDFEELKICIKDFMSFVHADTLMAKQLHFVNQVLFQTIFSSGFNDLETAYLFMSLVSPRFKVDEENLSAELLYEYRLLGGDLKTAGIDNWGIKDNRLEFIQLDSIDGNVHVDETYFFGQDNYRLPFESLPTSVVFKSIKVECLLEHDFIGYFKGKRIVFAPQNRMGSDFPFWELEIDERGQLHAVYSYSDFQGTKPSFYYPSALDDIYNSLKEILPGLKRSDWISRARLSEGEDIWYKHGPGSKSSLSPESLKSVQGFKQMRMKDLPKVNLEGLHYCGPGRARSLGLFSYLLDVFSGWKSSQ